MSLNGSRLVVAGLVSGWLIIIGLPAGVAAAQPVPPGVMLAQARPSSPPPPDVEANIASLRQRLQITPAQEPQFNAVANVLRANTRAEASAPQPRANTSAVDELRAEIQYDEIELAGLRRLLPALEALYATLSPQQRQAADMAFRQGPGGG